MGHIELCIKTCTFIKSNHTMRRFLLFTLAVLLLLAVTIDAKKNDVKKLVAIRNSINFTENFHENYAFFL